MKHIYALKDDDGKLHAITDSFMATAFVGDFSEPVYRFSIGEVISYPEAEIIKILSNIPNAVPISDIYVPGEIGKLVRTPYWALLESGVFSHISENLFVLQNQLSSRVVISREFVHLELGEAEGIWHPSKK